MENSKEKKLGQIFTEKFPPIERTNQEPTESMKAIFPWLQESVTNQISTDTKHFDELITQKTRQAVNSIRTELAEYRLKLDRVASEKIQQNDIDSIRSELAESKSKIDVMVNEITMFLEIINSINEEIARLKNNLGAVTLKQDDSFVVFGSK
jgi:hypothetical protein